MRKVQLILRTLWVTKVKSWPYLPVQSCRTKKPSRDSWPEPRLRHMSVTTNMSGDLNLVPIHGINHTHTHTKRSIYSSVGVRLTVSSLQCSATLALCDPKAAPLAIYAPKHSWCQNRRSPPPNALRDPASPGRLWLGLLSGGASDSLCMNGLLSAAS